jgi:hypothetical protein
MCALWNFAATMLYESIRAHRMSPQLPLFHEDVYDALRTCAKAMGGFKKVGGSMRPELSADKAGEWLADCLNPDRPQKLSLDQAMYLLREARLIGCHAGMYFIARDCGYSEPGPVEPEDEAADLERKFIAAAEAIVPMLTRIETLRARAKGRK